MCWLFPSCYNNRSVVISLMIRVEHCIQCIPCFSRFISEMLSEIHTVETFDFLKSIIRSQINKTSLFYVKVKDSAQVVHF